MTDVTIKGVFGSYLEEMIHIGADAAKELSECYLSREEYKWSDKDRARVEELHKILEDHKARIGALVISAAQFDDQVVVS